MSEPLETRIAAWLRSEGYPLELRVASLAKQAGFEVSQSDYYMDPDTKTPREIDVTLRFSRHFSSATFELAFAIECKSSRDKPWLVFGTKNHLPTLSEDAEGVFQRMVPIAMSFVSTKYADSLLIRQTVNGSYKKLFPTMDKFDFLGHGMTQAFAAAGDSTYKAATSAAKAATAYVARLDEFSEYLSYFTIATPLIVIDVPMFQVSLEDSDSELSITQTNSAVIIWKQPLGKRASFALYVVHIDALPDFLQKARAAAEWWTTQSTEQAAEVVAKVDKGVPKKTAA